ncbi:hypothetical protein NDU88_001417 [Pleurodeles waltl]|uniref:Uncharacterized protein n=1 Tax=Pleurodeles waltl TaxID=8319 RepID=A0AAV7VZ53_PLEWA|nr:hypothetical protein NDU88_001417 [Pleurodeles waltl]
MLDWPNKKVAPAITKERVGSAGEPALGQEDSVQEPQEHMVAEGTSKEAELLSTAEFELRQDGATMVRLRGVEMGAVDANVMGAEREVTKAECYREAFGKE